MANFNIDQADGLRRMLAGPKPRVYTFLSALPDAEKSAMLINLGTSLVRAGSQVTLLDACSTSRGVSSGLPMAKAATLLEVARQERALADVVQGMQQGFSVARLARASLQGREALYLAQNNADQVRRLAYAFGAIAREADIVVVDGELGKDDSFPLAAMTVGEIVVQVTNGADSIKSAYSIIKRLSARLGRRPFSVLVTGTSEQEAKVVYENMAQAASRYLAVELNSLGSVPADEHLHRAAGLGRAVIDAFPLAGASVAFRRLAGRCALSEMAVPGAQPRAMAAAGF